MKWARFLEEKGRLAAVLGALATWGLLQVFRPHFFLTDDSFSLFFPVWVDFGRKWFSGGDFFHCEWIFGGHYPLLEDPVFLPLLHPFCLLLSPLAATPWQTWMVDLVCLGHLILAAWGFEEMVARMRARGWVGVGPGPALIMGWSYTFSMYSLLLGSSGFWYLANVSALPWLVAGLMEKSRWRAALILALATFHGLVGGYPSCFLFTMVGITAFCVWLSWCDRDVNGLGRGLAGLLAGVLLALPCLWVPLSALGDSVRSGPIPLELAVEGRLPWAVAVSSFFLSSGSILLGSFELFGMAAHTYALVSCAASGWFLAASFRDRRGWSAWDALLGVALAGSLLLVCRPDFLGRLLGSLPFFSSLRWPHKEVFLVVFIAMVFALRGGDLSPKTTRLLFFASFLIFIAPLVLVGPPSLNAHSLSRSLYLDGKAARWVDEFRKWVPPGVRVASALPKDRADTTLTDPHVPWILLMSHNFPALWQIPAWGGYSATLPRRIYRRNPGMIDVYGHVELFDPSTAAADLAIWFLYWDPSQSGRIFFGSSASTAREIKFLEP
ncbi:MAG: hypothetical protein SFU85_07915 [Candidatus Methylacidiphilales bacterium]|nr:hypothetical protein [Candidatus Methylacidiphilales bacterium]